MKYIRVSGHIIKISSIDAVLPYVWDVSGNYIKQFSLIINGVVIDIKSKENNDNETTRMMQLMNHIWESMKDQP